MNRSLGRFQGSLLEELSERILMPVRQRPVNYLRSEESGRLSQVGSRAGGDDGFKCEEGTRRSGHEHRYGYLLALGVVFGGVPVAETG